MRPLRIPLHAALVLASALWVAGCETDSTTSPLFDSEVSFVNASADTQTIDVLIDGNAVRPSIAFGTASDYTSLRAGNRTLRVQRSGTSQVVLAENLSLARNTRYSIFFSGRDDTLASLTLRDTLTVAPTGRARVRFVNLSPDLPRVDLAVAGGVVLFPDQGYRGFTHFMEVDTTTFGFEVQAAGTATRLALLPMAGLRSGENYTLLYTGLTAGTGSQERALRRIRHAR